MSVVIFRSALPCSEWHFCIIASAQPNCLHLVQIPWQWQPSGWTMLMALPPLSIAKALPIESQMSQMSHVTSSRHLFAVCSWLERFISLTWGKMHGRWMPECAECEADVKEAGQLKFCLTPSLPSAKLQQGSKVYRMSQTDRTTETKKPFPK